MAPADLVVRDLDDPACRDPEVAGGKAAALSRARAAGLPALPGRVVPTGAAKPARDAALAALSTRGSGGARLAAQSTAVPVELEAALRQAVDDLGAPAIARSSATVEHVGTWSGAFSTFADIDGATIVTAVKGCWASVFGVDALERAEHSGQAVGEIGMAVLVQPMLAPRVSGHARAGSDLVELVAVAGSPAGLMSGWVSGQRANVASSGAVDGPALELLTAAEAREVAELARRCRQLLGHPSIEWAWCGAELVLLQSSAGDAPRAPAASAGVAELPALDLPVADRLAQVVHRFAGGVSEELVLPWAVGVGDPRLLDGLCDAGPADHASPRPWASLRAAADRLAAQVWSTAPGSAERPWDSALRQLRGDRPESALRAVDALAEPSPDAARQLLRDILQVGSQAQSRGLLRRPADVFGCERADLDPTRAALPRQSWAGSRRWEPFLAAVTQTRGRRLGGTAAAPGVGAGPAQLERDLAGPAAPRRERGVLVADHPVPALSGLLWNAAGLVTRHGSTGAHLLEVARSLGVPAVVQCARLPLEQLGPDTLLAVDGDRGEVSVHEASPALAR